MDPKSEEAKRQYDLADERMEKIFDEALAEIERLKAENEELKRNHAFCGDHWMTLKRKCIDYSEALEKIRKVEGDTYPGAIADKALKGGG